MIQEDWAAASESASQPDHLPGSRGDSARGLPPALPGKEGGLQAPA